MIRTGTTIFKKVEGENLKYPAIKHTIAKGSGVVAASMMITQPYFKKRSPYRLNFFWSIIIFEILASLKCLPAKKAIIPQKEEMIPKANTIKENSLQLLDWYIIMKSSAGKMPMSISLVKNANPVSA